MRLFAAAAAPLQFEEQKRPFSVTTAALRLYDRRHFDPRAHSLSGAASGLTGSIVSDSSTGYRHLWTDFGFGWEFT